MQVCGDCFLHIHAGMCFLAASQDNYSYNIAMAACAGARKWVVAVSLLQLMMETPHLQPDSFSYCAVISACGHARHWARALEFFQAAERGHLAGRVIFNEILDVLEEEPMASGIFQLARQKNPSCKMLQVPRIASFG
ncbi:unnamed protein product [Durusdinium trenchii]|uniref:Pentatricopeptide repeat-containing protein n=1 Tax=Durusdinium trenchii TaxID=1381693 RepID=A0ABP0Q7F0_9DINO